MIGDKKFLFEPVRLLPQRPGKFQPYVKNNIEAKYYVWYIEHNSEVKGRLGSR